MEKFYDWEKKNNICTLCTYSEKHALYVDDDYYEHIHGNEIA